MTAQCVLPSQVSRLGDAPINTMLLSHGSAELALAHEIMYSSINALSEDEIIALFANHPGNTLFRRMLFKCGDVKKYLGRSAERKCDRLLDDVKATVTKTWEAATDTLMAGINILKESVQEVEDLVDSLAVDAILQDITDFMTTIKNKLGSTDFWSNFEPSKILNLIKGFVTDALSGDMKLCMGCPSTDGALVGEDVTLIDSPGLSVKAKFTTSVCTAINNVRLPCIYWQPSGASIALLKCVRSSRAFLF